MRTKRLKEFIFLALCCDLGLFSKRLVAPFSNLITDFLHIPGGIGTSFSLMFLVIAALFLPRFGCAALMGAVQSVLALSMGMVGSMGILAPIGYIVPGFFIDCTVFFSRKCHLDFVVTAILANMLSAAAASLTANVIVFHLSGLVLLLDVAVALTSGAFCGIVGSSLITRIHPVIYFEQSKDARA